MTLQQERSVILVMLTKKVEKIKVIQTEDPTEFQEQYNSIMETLHGTEYHVELKDMAGTHCAYVFYEEVQHEYDRVSDEFHAEGIRYLCAQCPHHDPVTDGRKKHVWCKYADCGMTHLQHEACELFYKQLKQGEVKPL